MANSKGHKEAFARFFEEPTREGLPELLRQNTGETRDLDFKEAWPKSASIAKQALGFANIGDGCVVVGIKENDDGSLDPVGLEKLIDKAEITDKIKIYIPSDVLNRLSVLNFVYEASEYPRLIGKRFQVLLIEYRPDHTPAVCLTNGDGIRAGAIYVRREGQTEEGTHDEIQRIINKRIETRYSTTEETSLKQHLEQLRALYSEIPRSISVVHSSS